MNSLPLLLSLLLQPACGCGPEALPWQIAQPPIGTIGIPAAYIESLSPPPGDWCYVGDLTDWACLGGVVVGAYCTGSWTAVGRLPIEPGSRWVVIAANGENCLPCYEDGCMSRIFSDGFNDGTTRRWSERHG